MNHYETLEVSKNASAHEIKTAFRKKAMRYHPDRNLGAGRAAAESFFKNIAAAYDVLSDPNKKAHYDRRLAEDSTAQAKHGRQYTYNNTTRHTAAQKKELSVRITVSFWDAVQGGQIEFVMKTGPLKGAQVSFTLPAGANNGEAFYTNEIAGYTLVVTVLVEDNPHYSRVNLDLFVQADINFDTAILGGHIFIRRGPEGAVKVVVPPGYQQGQQIIVPNAGIAKGPFVGDLYVTGRIKTPTKINERQKNLLKQFSEENSVKQNEVNRQERKENTTPDKKGFKKSVINFLQGFVRHLQANKS